MFLFLLFFGSSGFLFVMVSWYLLCTMPSRLLINSSDMKYYNIISDTASSSQIFPYIFQKQSYLPTEKFYRVITDFQLRMHRMHDGALQQLLKGKLVSVEIYFCMFAFYLFDVIVCSLVKFCKR